MKHLTINSILVATVAVLAAGSASAQTLKADIPFTFRAAGAVMTPGTYEIVNASSTAKFVRLRNTETRNSVLAVYRPTDPAKQLQAHGTPAIQFECSGGECALSQIWTGTESPAYGFRLPKFGSDGDRRTAVIPLTSVKAD
jgi:hypothetical protein